MKSGFWILALVTVLLWLAVGFLAVEAMTNPPENRDSAERRQVALLCFESGSLSREEAVDKSVYSPCNPVSNLLDIDQALKAKHPGGGIKTPRRPLWKNLKSSLKQASTDKSI
jgi:hypothetical protein